MKHNFGFTLIELLVSMSLLSLIILISSSSFGLLGQHWDGRLGKFDESAITARNRILVQNTLDSLVPYVAENKEGKHTMYFDGNRNGFVAVASQSIHSPDDHAVIRLSVRQNSDSTFEVLYEEWPMDEQLLLTTGNPLPFNKPMTLFKSVTNPAFEYFGTPTMEERLAEDGIEQAPPRWTQNFDGVEAGITPIKIRLNFDTESGRYEMPANFAFSPSGLLSRYQTGEDDCNC